ncbi:saccharopine dehydrogenase NADP-binding domain-containing protein [Alkalihalobacillus pseudalcaliphilus]|uniref:saccharopine dehydrogenase NADP-binding domain-containing protein n=1 Tax=Alkalihalobacillus pseudalcaliphilus TaxID=79884 RepID=UPI00064DCEDF|nr:saccharopine dehydrogenase NADP-binding domain-containing protein [Alkalihalobacillus pseudalcaliphilus]KMK74989.1 hypothetical protein AB990_16075 [Alkalihalobacillus pseudalcaliphilus]
MKKILIVGATGTLGQLVYRDIRRLFPEDVTFAITDYNKERGIDFASNKGKGTEWRYLNVMDAGSIEQALVGVDFVVILVKQLEPKIQELCIERKIPSLDVTPFYALYTDTIKYGDYALGQETGVLLFSGFLPGLSGLLIQKAVANFDKIESVDIGFLQNKNANVGITGIKDMLRLINEPIRNQEKTFSFSQTRKMSFLGHQKPKKVRNIEHAERLLLIDKYPISYWTGWSDNTFNTLIYILKKAGLLPFIIKLSPNIMKKIVKHNPENPEEAILTVEVKGHIQNKLTIKRYSLQTFSDYQTTSLVTAALLKIMLSKQVDGVVVPYEITNIDEVLGLINNKDIKLEEIE